ncbi:MAG: hypothetical protein H0X40_04460 [Chthoniobacterales bacterium]|nr:hypothetical protein [Chthoniobacterales bacterium]
MKILWRLFARAMALAEKWGGKIERIWAPYWLLIVGGFLVVASTGLKWVEFPFSRNLKGVQLPLFQHIGLLPHLSIFSFGVLAIGVLLVGIILSRFSVAFLAAAAAILLTIFALVPAHLAFEQPGLLSRLTEEDQTMPIVNAFSKNFLPQNYGASEIVPKRLQLYSGWGRFVGAWSFLRLGWTCFGIGALLVGLYALSRLRGARLSVALVLFGLPFAALVIVLAPAMIGQYYFTKASLAKAEGRSLDAIAAFRSSMRWDGWHAQDIDLYATIGDLQRSAGVEPNSRERSISQALTLEKAAQFEQAVFELEGVAQKDDIMALTARREAARAHTSLGLALYQAGGIGSAVTNWQAALAEDPTQVYALTYLARGYFMIGSYEASIKAVDQLVPIVRDHNQLLANAYSIGADSYAKLGRDAEARNYYNLSLAADPLENYWALTGLVGE